MSANIITTILGIVIIVMAIMAIAVNSIGIESYNKLKSSNNVESEEFVEKRKSNKNMLIISLVCAIILLVIGSLMSVGGIVRMTALGDDLKKYIPVVSITRE